VPNPLAKRSRGTAVTRQQKTADPDFLELVVADEVTRREARPACLPNQ
jgi:hypothetical protein